MRLVCKDIIVDNLLEVCTPVSAAKFFGTLETSAWQYMSDGLAYEHAHGCSTSVALVASVVLF